MLAISERPTNQLVGERSPQQIHELYLPNQPIPIIERPDELEAIYIDEGYTLVGGIMCLPELTVRDAFHMMSNRLVGELGRGALLGPYTFGGERLTSSVEGFSCMGLWLPSVKKI